MFIVKILGEVSLYAFIMDQNIYSMRQIVGIGGLESLEIKFLDKTPRASK